MFSLEESLGSSLMMDGTNVTQMGLLEAIQSIVIFIFVEKQYRGLGVC